MDRVDGRKADENRPVKITRGYTMYAEGSVLTEVGNTKVLCNASVEEKVPPFLKGNGQGWVTAEYSMLPRATEIRNVREAARGKIGGRTQEIQRLIGRALRSVVDLKALGERTIWIDCDVLQADGGTRTASITGGFVALVDALNKLLQAKKITKIPLFDYMAATSVGIVDETLLLDLCFEEDSRAQVDMNIVMTGSGRFVEVQGTAEQYPYTRQEMNGLLELAEKGINELVAVQKEVIGDLVKIE